MGNFFVNNALTRAFWGDEAWTALISALPLPDLVKTTAADFHPPLYYTLVHFWMQAFGNSEVSLRLISLLFWLLAGIAACFFARSLNLSRTFRLRFAYFVWFNPFLFLYAFEARNYTLFVFLSVCSMWFFYLLLRSPRPIFLTGYLLFTLAGLYTHYFMFFLLAAQYLFVVLFRRDLFKHFLLLAVCFLLLYLPWLPFFFSQVKSVAGGYWIAPLTPNTVWGTVETLIRGEYTSAFSAGLLLFFGVYLLLAVRTAWQNKSLKTPETALFLIWFCIPFLLPILVSFYRPLFFYRYLIFTAVPVMLLPLFWLASATKRPATPGALLIPALFPLLLLAAYLYIDWLTLSRNTRQLFKPVLAEIHAQARPGDVIYTVLPSFAEVVYYNQYDGAPLPVKVLPRGLQQASGKALLDTYVRNNYLTLEDLPPFGRYWYLEPGPTFRLVEK